MARFSASNTTVSRTADIVERPITVMFWGKISVDTNAYATFFRLGGGGSASSCIIGTPADGATFNIWDGGADISGSALVVGQWYHMALSITTGDVFTAYLNGEVNITGSTDIEINQYVIGALEVGSSTEPLNGCVEALKIYGAVLDQRRIKEEAKQYVPVNMYGLHTWSPMRFPYELIVNLAGGTGLWAVNGTITQERGPNIPWALPLRRRVYFVPGGGVLYTTTLAASLSPAGLIVKQVNKLLAGTASPSGVVRRQPNKVLAASLTPSGNVVKRGLKVLSGVVTPVGTVMVTAIYAIVLAGALAVSGTVVKQVNKRVAGALAVSGNVMKQGNKVLGGVITPVGGLVKQVNKVLGGTVIPVGSLIVRVAYSIVLSGALGVAGSLTKQVNKVLTASLAVSGLLSKQKNISLAGSLGVSGGLVKQVQKVLAGVITPVGGLTTARRMVVVLAGALVPVGSLVKRVNKGLFASVAVSGSIVKQVNKVLNGAVSPIGVVRKQVDKVLNAVVTPVGALTGNRIFQVVLSGVLGVSGAIASVFINGTGVVIRGLVPWIRRRRR